MNKVLDPLLLKDTASRGQVAVTYALLGLAIGVFFFGSNE